jgi:hypothetical protein
MVVPLLTAAGGGFGDLVQPGCGNLVLHSPPQPARIRANATNNIPLDKHFINILLKEYGIARSTPTTLSIEGVRVNVLKEKIEHELTSVIGHIYCAEIV